MMEVWHKKRIISSVLVITILFVMALSVYSVISHTGHECDGIDCSVCCMIHVLRETVKLLGAALIAGAFSAYLYQYALSFANVKSIEKCYVSLFSLKVRLNN